jgi:hypothetical protein
MQARMLLSRDLMLEGARFDVSVVMPFGDDEEAVGLAVRRTAEYLRQLGVSFELLAVDEDSGDNSHAVLALLRADVPELRVTHAPARGRGVDAGAARAQGTLLLVTTPDVAAAALDGVGDAVMRLLRDVGDAEVALGRFTVAHRVRSLAAFRGTRVVGAAMHRRLSKRLQVHNLSIQLSGGGAVAKTPMGRLRAFARI